MTRKSKSVIKLFTGLITFIKSLNYVSKISWFAGKFTKINLHGNFAITLPIKPN